MYDVIWSFWSRLKRSDEWNGGLVGSIQTGPSCLEEFLGTCTVHVGMGTSKTGWKNPTRKEKRVVRVLRDRKSGVEFRKEEMFVLYKGKGKKCWVSSMG